MKLPTGGLAIAVLCVTMASSLGWEGTAAAQEQDDPLEPAHIENAVISTVTSMAKGSLQRARRAIAIGPTAGGAFTRFWEAKESAGSVTFGLSFYKFKVPIFPDSELVKDVLKKRLKVKLLEVIKRRSLDGLPPLTKAEQENLVLEIMQEIKAEFLGESNMRARTFERPSFALTVEGDYNLTGSVMSVRTRIGMGVSRLLIGPTLALHFPSDVIFSAGGEMALLVVAGKGPRSPVFDVFLRAEFPINDARDAYSFGVGVRVLVDII
jgi:hypothetical protein